jgi:hypothetical protein
VRLGASTIRDSASPWPFDAKPPPDAPGSVRRARDRKEAGVKTEASYAVLAATERISHVGVWQWDARTNAVLWSNETARLSAATPSRTCRRSLTTP